MNGDKVRSFLAHPFAGLTPRFHESARQAASPRKPGAATDPLQELEKEAAALQAAAAARVAGSALRTTPSFRQAMALPASPRKAELLAETGHYAEAVSCYLELGLVDEASQLAARCPDHDRLQAQVLLQTGHPEEAGDLLARHGLPREAALAYETAGDWGRAAYRWEAAGDLPRAARAYEKSGRLRDASRCYTAAGLPRQAEEVLGPPAAARPRPGSRLLQTARRCLDVGDAPRAAALLLQMQPGEDGFADGSFLLAPLLLEEGFAQDALDRLRRIPPGEARRCEAEVDYWEGRCEEALGHRDAAAACYERLMARAPEHRDARARLEALLPREAPVVEPLGVGGKLGARYELLAELGRGGMARVYKALDLELGEVVAIKTLLAPDEGFGEEVRLLREVQICRRISHPNVVRVYDIGRFAGGLFVTMEYIEGESLERLITREAPLPFPRIRFLLGEIAAGLQEAHAQGIVHRDLKPANLMVTGNRLKILDFGIARMAGIGARLTQTGCVLGTPLYMSPDQLRGQELDGRSDLYSFGIVAFTLIAGREPFDAPDATALALKQLHETPPDVRRFRPETPAPWADFLERLLKKAPAERYQTAHEVLEVLATLPT